MSVRKILIYPDPFLREKAEPVERVDSAVKELIDDMVETMYHGRGLGLAATQVGVCKRVIVLDVPEPHDESVPEERRPEPHDESVPEERRPEPRKGVNLLKLVNPEIIEASGEIRFEEGCLSLPGVTAEVKRAAEVVVRALNEDGEPVEIRADGLLAIALQHEIDHLDGILFIDHLSRLKRNMVLRRFKKAMMAEKAL